jgi:hypothetical protein
MTPIILHFDNCVNSVKKSVIKRDGPVFFSTAPVKVASDERMIMAIVAPHWAETSHTTIPYLAGQTCRFAPTKKLPCLPMLPSKNPHEPNPFPETQPSHGILHFLSVPICGLKTSLISGDLR